MFRCGSTTHLHHLVNLVQLVVLQILHIRVQNEWREKIEQPLETPQHAEINIDGHYWDRNLLRYDSLETLVVLCSAIVTYQCYCIDRDIHKRNVVAINLLNDSTWAPLTTWRSCRQAKSPINARTFFFPFYLFLFLFLFLQTRKVATIQPFRFYALLPLR